MGWEHAGKEGVISVVEQPLGCRCTAGWGKESGALLVFETQQRLLRARDKQCAGLIVHAASAEAPRSAKRRRHDMVAHLPNRVGKWMAGWQGRWMGGWLGGRVDGWMDGVDEVHDWVEGWMVRWKGGKGWIGFTQSSIGTGLWNHMVWSSEAMRRTRRSGKTIPSGRSAVEHRFQSDANAASRVRS